MTGLRRAVLFALLCAACGGGPERTGTDVPPPRPGADWVSTDPDARVTRDGSAVRITAGARSTLALAEDVAGLQLPWTLRTQLWRESGPGTGTYGVAFGLQAVGTGWLGCVLEIDATPSVRLLGWRDGAMEALGTWASVPEGEPDAEAPDEYTGAYAIRDVSLSFRDGLELRVDGRAVEVPGDAAACASGRAGVFVGPSGQLRVGHFTVQ